MSPNELIDEFQSKDYDYFLRKMLDAVPDNVDKREGSIIYDALAPAALVMGQQSLDMANVIKETYIKTASGEFLDYRAIEHGTSRYPATQTEAKAKVLNDKKEPGSSPHTWRSPKPLLQIQSTVRIISTYVEITRSIKGIF